jgi:uncharacterized protein (TIGR02996 family)
MHTDDDFLRKIRENPFDDAIRMVYADWLEDRAHEEGSERKCETCRGIGWKTSRWRIAEMDADDYGQSTVACDQCRGTGRIHDTRVDRAEFIRLQCELEQYQAYHEWLENMSVEQWSGDPEEGVLLRRLYPLVKRHTELCHQYVRDCKTWSKEFISQILGPNWLSASASWQWWWKRGFVSSISCTLTAFQQHAGEIFSKHPVTEVRLTDLEPNSANFVWDTYSWTIELPTKLSESLKNYSQKSGGWMFYSTPELARLALIRRFPHDALRRTVADHHLGDADEIVPSATAEASATGGRSATYPPLRVKNGTSIAVGWIVTTGEDLLQRRHHLLNAVDNRAASVQLCCAIWCR